MLRAGLAVLVAFSVLSCSGHKTLKSSHVPEVNIAIDQATDLLGTPYCPGGATDECFDCSGFVAYCYDRAGVILPRISRDMAEIGEVVKKEELKVGDLVFFSTKGRSISHVGIYYGRNSFIHSSTSSGVIISKLDDLYWSPRFVLAKRLPYSAYPLNP